MYYLFDERMIQAANNIELVLGEVKKSMTEASWIDQYKWTKESQIPEWEHRVSLMYPHVIYDAEGISVDGVSSAKYKIWYHSYCTQNPNSEYKWFDFIIDKSNSRNVEIGKFENHARGTFYSEGYVLCYMESDDGIHWRRPDCGEFYYQEQDGKIVGTNIVLIGPHGTGVHLNTHPKAGKEEPMYLMATNGTLITWSDDGVHWEELIAVKDGNKTANYMPGDTHNQLMWSPELGRYIVISRGYVEGGFEQGIRTVVKFTSTDELISLRDLEKLVTYEEVTKFWTEPEHVLTGEKNAQPYSMPILYADKGTYIGVLSVADFDENTQDIYQQVWAELTWSPDCENWFYVKKGTPFIKNAEEFRFKKGNDYGMIYCAAPVVTNEDTKIFYAAMPELHYFKYEQIPDEIKTLMEEENPGAAKDEFITRSTTLNCVSIPHNRYAGRYSKDGYLLTKGLKVGKSEIFINVDVKEGGSITVALQNLNGEVIEGFAHRDFSAIPYSDTESLLSWKGKLSDLEGQTVCMEFRIKDAVLYTIEGV